MMLLITWKSALIGTTILLLLVAIGHFWLKYYTTVELLRFSDAKAIHLQAELKKKEEEFNKIREDEKELLFVRILQWKKLAEDYRVHLKQLALPIKNKDLNQTIDILEKQFLPLFASTETDRKKLMEKIKNADDYDEQMKLVVDELAKAFIGLQSGAKADESPLLNDNRDN